MHSAIRNTEGLINVYLNIGIRMRRIAAADQRESETLWGRSRAHTLPLMDRAGSGLQEIVTRDVI